MPTESCQVPLRTLLGSGFTSGHSEGSNVQGDPCVQFPEGEYTGSAPVAESPYVSSMMTVLEAAATRRAERFSARRA